MASVQMGGRGRGGIVGINVTPFVDIALVLLIIMMVSSTYIVSQALKVELPKTATSDDSVARTYLVTIGKEGELLFNNTPVNQEGLERELKKSKEEGGDISLVISADAAAHHGNVVGVIDTAKLLGITKFAINVDRSKK